MGNSDGGISVERESVETMLTVLKRLRGISAVLGERRLTARGGCLGRRHGDVVARASWQNESGGVNERIRGETRCSEALLAMDGTIRSLGTMSCMVVGTQQSVAAARIGTS